MLIAVGAPTPVGDGILITDSEGHLEQINPAAAAMLAVTREQVLRQKAEQCFNKNPALVNLFTRPTEQTLDVRLPRRRLAVGMALTLADAGCLDEARRQLGRAAEFAAGTPLMKSVEDTGVAIRWRPEAGGGCRLADRAWPD